MLKCWWAGEALGHAVAFGCCSYCCWLFLLLWLLLCWSLFRFKFQVWTQCAQQTYVITYVSGWAAIVFVIPFCLCSRHMWPSMVALGLAPAWAGVASIELGCWAFQHFFQKLTNFIAHERGFCGQTPQVCVVLLNPWSILLETCCPHCWRKPRTERSPLLCAFPAETCLKPLFWQEVLH